MRKEPSMSETPTTPGENEPIPPVDPAEDPGHEDPDEADDGESA